MTDVWVVVRALPGDTPTPYMAGVFTDRDAAIAHAQIVADFDDAQWVVGRVPVDDAYPLESVPWPDAVWVSPAAWVVADG